MNDLSIGGDESGSYFCTADIHSDEVRVVWDSRHTIRTAESWADIVWVNVLAAERAARESEAIRFGQEMVNHPGMSQY